MSKRMSCSLTIDAVKDRTKTVTRRHVNTWTTLKIGDRIALIEKGMGLAKGQKQVILAEVEVTAVDLVQLYGISDEEIEREGFPDMDHLEFVDFWLDSHSVPPFRTQSDAMAYEVRRIEWRYVPIESPWGSCDWGGCNAEAGFWRWWTEGDQWLPVCSEHRQ